MLKDNLQKVLEFGKENKKSIITGVATTLVGGVILGALNKYGAESEEHEVVDGPSFEEEEAELIRMEAEEEQE